MKPNRNSSCRCRWCGKSNLVKNSLVHITPNNLNMYFCNDECYKAMSRDELLASEIEYMFISMLNAKGMTKSLKTYIHNQIKPYKDNDRLLALHSVFKNKHQFFYEHLKDKSFSNSTVKAKYIFKSIENDVEKEYQALTKLEQIREIKEEQTHEMISFSNPSPEALLTCVSKSRPAPNSETSTYCVVTPSVIPNCNLRHELPSFVFNKFSSLKINFPVKEKDLTCLY
jgi:hypothetical protein